MGIRRLFKVCIKENEREQDQATLPAETLGLV